MTIIVMAIDKSKIQRFDSAAKATGFFIEDWTLKKKKNLERIDFHSQNTNIELLV